MTTTKKGFTLIELLIVIGILAILATTVVLVLNPAQLLAETRDTQRITDLDNLRSAINLFLTSKIDPDLDFTSVGTCGTNWWTSNNGVALAAGLADGLKPFATPAAVTASQALSATPRAISGAGWLPIDFSSLSTGSPLANLPVDPNANILTALNGNPGGRFYAYQCDGTAKTYELNANMESTKYNNLTAITDSTGPEGTDGGTDGRIYEVGNKPGLNL